MRIPGLGPALAIAVLAAGCAPGWYHTHTAPAVAPAPPPAPLPELTTEQRVDTAAPFVAPGRYDVPDPLARLPLGEPVTLSATAVSVPALLVALGEAVGISLVLDPEITGEITVAFQDVPAREALRTVLEQAGLFIATGPPEVPWAPVVFYAVPVDIDEASVETIQARFGVSRTMAEFIVRSRVRDW